MAQSQGTSAYIQVQKDDWDEINRALRYIWEQLDALTGRRGNIALGSDLNLNDHKAINAAAPTADTDLINKQYADENYGATAIRKALVTLQQGTNPLTPLVSGSGIVSEGTHAQRLLVAASSQQVGSVFLETDRTTVYIVVLNAGVQVWQWVGGLYYAALASIPVDLGTTDVGFLFVNSDSDTNTCYVWTGTEFLTIGGYLQEVADAITAAVTTVMLIRHSTSGVAASGFGAAVVTQLEDSSGANQTAAYDTVEWSNAPTTSSLRRWYLRALGVVTAVLGIESDGTLTTIGNYVWKSGTSFFGTLDHAITANRTYTFSDADGNIVYETASLTNNSITLGGGNALVKAGPAGTTVTVLHGNAAGAPTYGAVNLTLDITGILNVANGGTGVGYDRISENVVLASQSAAIGSTNFANSSTAGTFRCNYYLEDVAIDLTAGTIQLSVAFTDAAGATTVNSTALALTALGRTSGVFFIQLASGSIAYSTTLVGIIGTARYSLYMCLERLS